MGDPWHELIESARAARARAICPHSGFAVGAALEDEAGRVWSAANVETDTLNLGLCAERVALLWALTHGGRGFRRIAIATEAESCTPPCGACRQLLWEFAAEAEILSVTATERRSFRVRELVPEAFDAGNFHRDDPAS